MRIFEVTQNVSTDKFLALFRMLNDRTSNKNKLTKLSWTAVQKLASSMGFEFGGDYESFKQLYDQTPALANYVSNFNERGIEVGSSTDSGAQDFEDSQDKIDKIASSAAPKQLKSQNKTPTP